MLPILALFLVVAAVGAKPITPKYPEPIYVNECPEPQGFGLCAEMCDSCEEKGEMCCSNGCGHQCMKPVVKVVTPAICPFPVPTKEPVVVGECPKPKGDGGACVEMCNNCEAKGELCCSNGCGHLCMKPVLRTVTPVICPFVTPAPAVKGRCPRPLGLGLCAEMCNNCEAKGKLCCSNGCGHQCMTPVTD